MQEPHPSRIPPDERELILEAHAAAIQAGEPGYIDPRTGLFVLTAAELGARGACCNQGCRHCPYPTEDLA